MRGGESKAGTVRAGTVELVSARGIGVSGRAVGAVSNPTGPSELLESGSLDLPAGISAPFAKGGPLEHYLLPVTHEQVQGVWRCAPQRFQS